MSLRPAKVKVKVAPPRSDQKALREKFKTLADGILQRLPTLEELEQLSDEEVHQTPKRLLEAGQDLGRIAEMLEAHPQELESEAFDFYSACSFQDEYPSSIRALCWSHLKGIRPGQAHDSQVPPHVQNLADQLAD